MTPLCEYNEGTRAHARRRTPPQIADVGEYKMAFDGCSVTNGTLGLLFAAGLRLGQRLYGEI